MPVLNLVITAAGYAALINAQGTGTETVTIAEVGVTSTAFVAAPTLLAVPNELKRISTVAGQAVADNQINLVMRDDEPDTYALRGFGLYLDDGTLFAAFSQPDVLVEKAGLASVLLTFDVVFTDAVADVIEFGDMTWTNPPATTEMMGVVELATSAETVAGVDTQRAVTPAGLASVLAGPVATSLALKADKARTVTGGGLVGGGGDLSADRVLSVTEASEAECTAGTAGDRAITPRRMAFYVAAQIAALIASSPAAMDTLNELAAALGNDPNFATTVATSIGLKADKVTTITATGSILTGGGDLSANRTFTVAEASEAQIDSGASNAAALTPRRAAYLLAKAVTAGDIKMRANSTVPTGWLECNGAAVSRTTYAVLFAAIGTTYGVGDGATTFNLPDLRGEFVRGWDNGRGIDAGRSIGSQQTDELKSHTHTVPSNSDNETGNGYVEDANGTGTARTVVTGSTGGSETRPRNTAVMFVIKT